MKKKYVINPLYWPFWLIYGILRLLVLLPYRTQMTLGKGLGRVIYFFPLKSKKTAVTNLALCFPELSDQERKKLLKKNYSSVGQFVFEVMLAFWGSPEKLNRIPLEVEGFEHYKRAVKKGRGVLLAGPHFTSLEIVGRLVSLRQPFVAMYRKSKLGFLENLLRPSLEKHYSAVVESRDLRGLFRVLKKGLGVWYAADIDGGKKQCVFAPFFGVPAATITAPSRIVQKTGATLLAVGFYRYRKGLGYTIKVQPMPDDYAQGNLESDARVLNNMLENFVREQPDQYFWQYKRFKTRPNNEPRFYQ